MVNLTGTIILALHLQTDHLGEFARQGITNDADDTDGTTADHREGQGVVAGNDIKVLGFVLDDFVNLFKIATGLFDSHDIMTVASQTDSGLCLHVHTSASRNVIEDNRQLSGRSYRFEMLIESFL